MYLIGSQALKINNMLPSYRKCADWDLMATPFEVEMLFNRLRISDYKESKNYQGKYTFTYEKQRYEIDATLNESQNILRKYRDDFVSGIVNLPIDTGVYVVSPAVSYVLKRSHAGTPIHVNKTLADLIHLTRHFCGEVENTYQFLTEPHLLLLAQLKTEAESRDAVRKQKINFNKPYDDFFKPAADLRVYDHDRLHEVTCRWDTPLYKENLKYADRALIDMKKFKNRSLDYRITMAQEEAVVIGLERYYINNSNMPAAQVFKQGMTKLISSLSKGEFQNFLLDQIHLLTKPRWDFMKQFENAKHEGLI